MCNDRDIRECESEGPSKLLDVICWFLSFWNLNKRHSTYILLFFLPASSVVTQAISIIDWRPKETEMKEGRRCSRIFWCFLARRKSRIFRCVQVRWKPNYSQKEKEKNEFNWAKNESMQGECEYCDRWSVYLLRYCRGNYNVGSVDGWCQQLWFTIAWSKKKEKMTER